MNPFFKSVICRSWLTIPYCWVWPFSVGRKYFFMHRVKIFSDGEEVYRLKAPGPDGGLFEYAGLPGENIWAGGGPMAPFDKPFYLIISVQTGDT